MSKIKRGIVLVVSFLLLSIPCSLSAFAAEQNIPEKGQALYDMQPRADLIVTKFRTSPITGKHQYRRWNETQNRWKDPYWIDA